MTTSSGTSPSSAAKDGSSARIEDIQNKFLDTDFARSYNARTGGCNIQLADHLIEAVQSHLPPLTPTPSPLRILDSATGPLILPTQCFQSPALQNYSMHISAVDISEAFITYNREIIASEPEWNTYAANGRDLKVDTAVMDGMDLKFPDATFDAAFTSLAIFAYPDPIKGARELHRTLKPGGVAALTTWKHVGWLPLLHRVERRLRPDQPPTRFPFLEPWSVPGKLAFTMREGGFVDVEEREVVAYAMWDGVEEASRWIAETLKVMVWAEWGEEEKEGMKGGFEEVLREEGGEGVVRNEGKVGFEMRAWVGVGRKMA